MVNKRGFKQEVRMNNGAIALWVRRAKNPNVSTRPLALSFACSLASLTHLLDLHCSLQKIMIGGLIMT